MTRQILPGIVAMATVVVASNILVQFLLGQWLTWGAFTYPFAFLVTDLVNRLQGAGAARRVVLWGFVVGIGCSFVGTQIAGEFGPLVTFRVALGSALAFLCGQLLDVAVFDRLRHQSWWKAPFISSIFGSSVDTVVFFAIAFSAAFTLLGPAEDVAWANELLPLLGLGPVVPLWMSLAVADWLVKIALSLIVLLPFRALVRRLSGRIA